MVISAPVSGDIRDLYAYYRFTDHEATSIALEDKKLDKQEIYFEGHMDWSFRRCVFNQAIYFGYEGVRLEEDTRETEDNPEPFPMYGFNALNFSESEINKPVFIKENCVVIFKACHFTGGCEVIMVGSSRVEFIDCVFDQCDISFSDFSTFKVTGCTHKACTSAYISAVSSKGAVHGCSFEDYAPDHVVHSDAGSEVVVTSPKSDLNSHHDCMYASNSSSISVFRGNKIQGKPAISAKNSSKIEVRDFKGLSSGALYGVFSDGGSEVFCSLVGIVHSGASNAARISGGSKARFDNVQLISSPVETALLIEDGSTVSANTVKEISSVDGKCVDATDSSVSINNVEMMITVDEDAIQLDNSVGYFRKVDLVAMVSGTAAVNIKNRANAYLSDVKVIAVSEGDALKADDAFLEDLRGESRIGELSAYHVMNDGVVTTREIKDVSTTSGPGILIEDAGVDIRTIKNLTGKTYGISGEDARGVIKDNTVILGTEDAGIFISGTSGPLSIMDNTSISSGAKEAVVLVGDHIKTLIGNITAIASETKAIYTELLSGTILFEDLLSVSGVEKGFDLRATGGYIAVTNISAIETKDKGLDLSFSGSAKATISGLKSTSGAGDTLFDLVLSEEAQVLVKKCDDIGVPNPFVIALGKNTKLIVEDMGKITGGNSAFSGVCHGELVIKRLPEMTASETVLSLSGASSPNSSVVIEDLGSINLEDGSGPVVSLTSFVKIALRRIPEISGGSSNTSAVYLTGISPSVGNISVLDVANISPPEGGGLYVKNGDKAVIRGVSGKMAISLSSEGNCIKAENIGLEVINTALSSAFPGGTGNCLLFTSSNGHPCILRNSPEVESIGECLSITGGGEVLLHALGAVSSERGYAVRLASCSDVRIQDVGITKGIFGLYAAESSIALKRVTVSEEMTTTLTPGTDLKADRSSLGIVNMTSAIMELRHTTVDGVLTMLLDCTLEASNSSILTLDAQLNNSLKLLNTSIGALMLAETSSLLGSGLVLTTPPLVGGSAIVCGNIGFDEMFGTGCAINVANYDSGGISPIQDLRTGIKLYNDAVGMWFNWGQW